MPLVFVGRVRPPGGRMSSCCPVMRTRARSFASTRYSLRRRRSATSRGVVHNPPQATLQSRACHGTCSSPRACIAEMTVRSRRFAWCRTSDGPRRSCGARFWARSCGPPTTHSPTVTAGGHDRLRRRAQHRAGGRGRPLTCSCATGPIARHASAPALSRRSARRSGPHRTCGIAAHRPAPSRTTNRPTSRPGTASATLVTTGLCADSPTLGRPGRRFRPATGHFLVYPLGTGGGFLDASSTDPDVSCPDPDPAAMLAPSDAGPITITASRRHF